jgi:site-specific recombinase XerD
MTGNGAGTWLARLYDGERYHHTSLGDFGALSDKERFDAAKRAAEQWFEHLGLGGSTQSHSVKAACEAYVSKQRAEKGPQAAADSEGFFRRLVYKDTIANVVLSKLTKQQCSAWRARVLEQSRTKSSFNRNITPLRAALNLAFEDGKVATDQAWRTQLKPLKGPGTSGRRTLYLDAQARRRLVENASEEARPLLQAMILQPVRPGDIPRARVQDLYLENRSLRLAGKNNERVIPLSDEALAHFRACAEDKLPSAWLVARRDGSQWKKEAWRDEVKQAAAVAKLPKATVATTLRHSVITELVKGGLDIFHVAKLAGTSVVMIEKHYGHLQDEHARAALQKLSLGVALVDQVTPKAA